MTEIPLRWQTISALSRRIHNGSLSPVALMEHLLHRIETPSPHAPAGPMRPLTMPMPMLPSGRHRCVVALAWCPEPRGASASVEGDRS
jgi:hypothetical protein